MIEVLGCGIFNHVGYVRIPSDEYTGFAFGIGPMIARAASRYALV